MRRQDRGQLRGERGCGALREDPVPHRANIWPDARSVEFGHQQRETAEFHHVQKRLAAEDDLVADTLGGQIAGKPRPGPIGHGDHDGEQLAGEVGPAVEDRAERRVKQDPVALPEQVRPGAVVRIMAELQRDLPELEIQLFCKNRGNIVRQRSVWPELVLGRLVPERTEHGDSLAGRAQVESQLADEFQRVQDPDRHRGCVRARVGDQRIGQLGPDLVEECADRVDQDLQERPGGHVMHPPGWRHPPVLGPPLKLDAMRDGLEHLQQPPRRASRIRAPGRRDGLIEAGRELLGVGVLEPADEAEPEAGVDEYFAVSRGEAERVPSGAGITDRRNLGCSWPARRAGIW